MPWYTYRVLLRENVTTNTEVLDFLLQNDLIIKNWWIIIKKYICASTNQRKHASGVQREEPDWNIR